MRHTREDDDQLILALQLRDEGVTFKEIGRILNKKPSQVIGMVDRVRRAIAEDEGDPGEPAQVEPKRGHGKPKMTITLPEIKL